MKNIQNEEAINSFIECLKLENKSPNTLKTYQENLKRFFSDQDETYDVLPSESIISLINSRYGHYKTNSRKVLLATLSSFYNYCVNEQKVDRTPIKKRWFPRKEQSIPKSIEKEEVAKIRLHLERASIRNQSMVEFMLSSGVRRMEVHNLNRRDVDIVKRTARVLGKGGKVRYVHFTEKCALLMEKYLESAPMSQAFFCTSVGKRLSKNQIYRIVRRIGKDTVLKTPLHPHRFRHTFSTELMAKGADLLFISNELGHRNLATTMIYARLPKQNIISMYRKYMG